MVFESDDRGSSSWRVPAARATLSAGTAQSGDPDAAGSIPRVAACTDTTHRAAPCRASGSGTVPGPLHESARYRFITGYRKFEIGRACQKFPDLLNCPERGFVHIDHHPVMIDPKPLFHPPMPLETRPTFHPHMPLEEAKTCGFRKKGYRLMDQPTGQMVPIPVEPTTRRTK